MGIFELMEEQGHEELSFCYHRPTGLQAILAIHNTVLGPAVGGCNAFRYTSEDTAIQAALRLSSVMTYQAAVTHADKGGGKAILMLDTDTLQDEAYFRALGRFIEGYKGRLIIQPDLGTSGRDLAWAKRETSHVVGESSPLGVNVSELSTRGIHAGLKACVKQVFDANSLKGLKIAVQGCGEIGCRIIDICLAEGAQVLISDLNFDKIKEVADQHPHVKLIPPADFIFTECDVLAPCAIGPVIFPQDVERLRCKVIAGAAYNIYSDESVILGLHQRGILAVPDFVLNAAEMLLLETEGSHGTKEELLERVDGLYDIMIRILSRAKADDRPPYQVTLQMAQERLSSIGALKAIYC